MALEDGPILEDGDLENGDVGEGGEQLGNGALVVSGFSVDHQEAIETINALVKSGQLPQEVGQYLMTISQNQNQLLQALQAMANALQENQAYVNQTGQVLDQMTGGGEEVPAGGLPEMARKLDQHEQVAGVLGKEINETQGAVLENRKTVRMVALTAVGIVISAAVTVAVSSRGDSDVNSANAAQEAQEGPVELGKDFQVLLEVAMKNGKPQPSISFPKYDHLQFAPLSNLSEEMVQEVDSVENYWFFRSKVNGMVIAVRRPGDMKSDLAKIAKKGEPAKLSFVFIESK